MRFLRDEHGQSFTETALLLPILVFLILAGGDLARAYAMQLAVQNGARAGAEAAAIDFTRTETEAAARAPDELSRTPGMDGYNTSTVHVTLTCKKIDWTTDCGQPGTAPN